MASDLSRTGGPSTPSAAPQSQPPHHTFDDDTQEPGMACPRRAAAARLRAGGSRIGTNARKQPSPARGSSHAPDHCAVGVLMHPPVTDVGVRLLAPRTPSPCARATAVPRCRCLCRLPAYILKMSILSSILRMKQRLWLGLSGATTAEPFHTGIFSTMRSHPRASPVMRMSIRVASRGCN